MGQLCLNWIEQIGDRAMAALARKAIAQCLLGHGGELPGPVGERNLYTLHPRGHVLAIAQTQEGLVGQLAAALSAGNRVDFLWLGLDKPKLPLEMTDALRVVSALPETNPMPRF
jgi:RHH-type proline utilization regulon transcriptional repressor/proline dehydrogenase/delta 1-pyrroline-5-carboxylate dehydrogenase